MRTMPAALLAAAVAVALSGGLALASPCSDEIDTLSKRVQEEGRDAIAASTSGKAEAGAREGQGVAGAASKTEAPPAPPEKSAEAGRGAERVQAAKVALDEARTRDGKGDAKGCDEAVSRARETLAKRP